MYQAGPLRRTMRTKFLSSVFIHFALLWNIGKVLQVDGSEEEYRLQKHLFGNYRKIRPVMSSRDPLIVSFILSLFRILRLDERDQSMAILVAVVERWNDTHLQWNPADYDGIRETVTLYESAWVPDIILYNSASETYLKGIVTTNLIVEYTGEVMLEMVAHFRSSCNINAKGFPFDKQTCTLLFMSLTQDQDKWYAYKILGTAGLDQSTMLVTDQIQMRVPNDRGAELVAYKESAEFKLELITVAQRNYTDPCCILPFSAVEYSITLSRKGMFFLVINHVLPMVVINIIALLAFLVPCESGEKVTLGISTMLNMIIFLTSIRDLLPPTEDIPLIGRYYCVCICLVGLEVGLSIFTLYLHHLEGVPFPRSMQKFCQILARMPFMRMSQFIEVENGKEKKMKKKGKDMVEMKEAGAERLSFPLFFDDLIRLSKKQPRDETHGNERETEISPNNDEQQNQERKEEPRMIRGQPDFLAHLENWRIASKILDRFFLFLFAVLNVAISIVIMACSGD
ncbi:unnamed protein product [Darwinula stevensoni]|uniref:Uncharacterized protein n=1 Tax=Darwinula stevensoni TaxID=69355 RepID=A0A7R8XJ28_9CRUS|nr:unnamed protein product [Darwinula stevensoni]CAG0893986.1 unnamed protein product [Darwinula stevensoni]